MRLMYWRRPWVWVFLATGLAATTTIGEKVPIHSPWTFQSSVDSRLLLRDDDKAPQKHRLLSLDPPLLAALLDQRRASRTNESSYVVLELPWPDGSFRKFQVKLTKPLAPGQFPTLETYQGRGIDDTSATVRLYWTPGSRFYAMMRFYAIMLSAEGTVLVSPYNAPSQRRLNTYIVYFRRDYWGVLRERCSCAMAGEEGLKRTSPPANGPRPDYTVSIDAPPAPIDEISLQPLFYGRKCSHRLTFRRDGSATRTLRTGFPLFTWVCRGSVTTQDYAALEELAQKAGFFSMKRTYKHGYLDHYQVVITSAVSAGRRKEVHNVDQFGPPTLQAIEDAIISLGKRIVWTEVEP